MTTQEHEPSPNTVFGKLNHDPEYRKLLEEEREKLDKDLPPQESGWEKRFDEEWGEGKNIYTYQISPPHHN
jgi:hypothetical protein